MKYVIYIFYMEILLNLASIFQTLFTPATFLASFASQTMPVAALEMARWYGVLICVLTYLLLRGLQKRGQAFILALEALLVGDVIQIAVSFVTASTLGGWPLNVILSIVLSIILAVARIICLWKPVETGVM